MSTAHGGGHLFIVRGDLRHIACDAWLLPTDRSGHVTSSWVDVPEIKPMLQNDYLVGLPSGWQDGKPRTHPLNRARPIAWATRVGGRSATPLDWYSAGLEAFLEAAAHQTASAGVSRKTPPLFAVPLVGAGHGGASFRRGGLTEGVVRCLLEFVKSNRVDVALVLNDEQSFAAAQAIRWRLTKTGAQPWASLPLSMLEIADELALHGATGRLVVFFGSGVSAGAGLPGWDELLSDLGTQAGLTKKELSALRKMDNRDQARIVELRLSDRTLKDAIRQHLQRDRYSLAHSLLANLPAQEFVTTNFDQLFEMAWRDSRGALRVLPYQADGDGAAWLLKLHGSLEKDDIVVTRADYLQLMRTRGALAAIVQAMLITRHMVFVGYSLRDDDFQEVVDDVRTALGAISRRVGTALLAEPAGFLKHLWQDTLQVVSASDESSTPSIAEGGRVVEIVLDRIVAQAMRASPAFVLDPTFAELLTPAERAAVEKLREAGSSVDPDSAVGILIRQVIGQMGGGPSH